MLVWRVGLYLQDLDSSFLGLPRNFDVQFYMINQSTYELRKRRKYVVRTNPTLSAVLSIVEPRQLV